MRRDCGRGRESVSFGTNTYGIRQDLLLDAIIRYHSLTNRVDSWLVELVEDTSYKPLQPL